MHLFLYADLDGLYFLDESIFLDRTNDGVYPTATDLGYAASNNLTLDDPTVIHPWLVFAQINNLQTPGCEPVSAMFFALDADQINYDDSTTFNLVYWLYDVDGVTHTLCYEGNFESAFATSQYLGVCDNSTIPFDDASDYITNLVCS